MTYLEALKAIEARNAGRLTPKAVVDAARPEDSPLHSKFCWDDTEAAEKYRILQAQELIRSYRVTITVDDTKYKGPVYLNVPDERTNNRAENVYRHIKDVQSSPDLMKSVTKEALEQLNALKNRYLFITKLKEIWDVIDKFVQAEKKPKTKKTKNTKTKKTKNAKSKN